MAVNALRYFTIKLKPGFKKHIVKTRITVPSETIVLFANEVNLYAFKCNINNKQRSTEMKIFPLANFTHVESTFPSN